MSRSKAFLQTHDPGLELEEVEPRDVLGHAEATHWVSVFISASPSCV